jgi:DNA-binding response OmpR family regulator
MTILMLGDAEQGTASLLESHAFSVKALGDAGEVVDAVRAVEPEMLLVEVVTPDAKVVRLCTRVRATHSLPILVSTGRCSETAIVNVYAAGVDAVLTRPIGDFEFVARVRALLRRIPTPAPRLVDTLVVGPVTLDRGSRELFVDGVLIPLPRREFDIAERLMRDAGRVVMRDTMIRDLWGGPRDSKTLDVQVGRLRTRLALVEGGRRRIVTVRGVGYRFLADDEVDEALTEETAVAHAGPTGSAPAR